MSRDLKKKDISICKGEELHRKYGGKQKAQEVDLENLLSGFPARVNKNMSIHQTDEEK